MKKVGITGLDSFLGRHLSWLLFSLKEEIELVDLDKDFNPSVEVVVHLASRSPKEIENPDDIYEFNISLAKRLLADCEKNKITPYIIFNSSTQIRNDNPYGKSKKDIGEMFRKWGNQYNSPVTNVIIPNEFGEGGVAYKTSVVSTFCEELISGKESTIGDGTVSLVHAQEVAQTIIDLIRNPKDEDVELTGVEMKISDLYNKLKKWKESYYADIIPNLENSLEIAALSVNAFDLHISFLAKKLLRSLLFAHNI